MKRRLELVDLMVAVGVVATLGSAYVMYMGASGMLQTGVPGEMPMMRSTGIAAAMEWVQPALGHAIVDEAITEREAERDMTQAVRHLNHVTVADLRLRASPIGHVDQIVDYAASVEAGQSARVQFVLGRFVTGFTARGVRSGVLSAHRLDGVYNRSMISLEEAMATRMNDAFQTSWQGHLGSMIVSATQDHLRFLGASQERIGESVVRLTQVQDGYQSAMEGIQEQLASVALASIHSEQIADRFEKLAAADLGAKPMVYASTQPKTWPDISFGWLFAASAALIVIFTFGIFAPVSRTERLARMQGEERPQETYRKTG